MSLVPSLLSGKMFHTLTRSISSILLMVKIAKICCWCGALEQEERINATRGYLDNLPSGHFAPDNSSPIFKQLAPRPFIHYRAKRAAKPMNGRLNVIQIILHSFIHYRTNYSLFFYPLPSLKIARELCRANCPGGELSGIRLEPSAESCILCVRKAPLLARDQVFSYRMDKKSLSSKSECSLQFKYAVETSFSLFYHVVIINYAGLLLIPA